MEIDLGNIISEQELHLKFKTALNFPDDYEMNWRDFDRAILEVAKSLPEEITIVNWKSFEADFPSEAEKLKGAITNFNREAKETEIAIETTY